MNWFSLIDLGQK